MTGFAADDIVLGGTANPITATVTGEGTSYNVAVTGMSGSGTVTIAVPENVAIDGGGNGNTAATILDNSVEFEFAQRSVFEVKTIDVKFAFSRGTGWFNQNAPILSATNSARNCYDANVTYLVSYIPP